MRSCWAVEVLAKDRVEEEQGWSLDDGCGLGS